MSLGLLGIFVSLILLITLAYRGVSVIIAAPLAALSAMLFAGVPLLATYTEIFMPALGGFIATYFPMFLSGAIFGRLMTVSGYASDLAQLIVRWLGPQRAILATVVTSALLTYGGISAFVAVFVVFPLARELFRAANLPRRLMPATIALGVLSFTMTALPGSPQVHNVIPGKFFGTASFAAPLLGIVSGAAMLGLGLLWLEYRSRSMRRRGESFADPTRQELRSGEVPTSTTGMPMVAQDASDRRIPVNRASMVTLSSGSAGSDHDDAAPAATRTDHYGDAHLTPSNHLLPFIPILLVFAVNLACTYWLFPRMDWGYLSEERFGGITLQDRLGLWSVFCALLAAILSILLLNTRHLKQLLHGFTEGARNAVLPIFNTGSEVGYGSVIASLAAFGIVKDGLFGLTGNALWNSAISTSAIAGVTGSATGGMTIALNSFGEDLRAQAVQQGIDLDLMHRLTAMASGGLDSLPHNGAVITLLMVCGLSHREAYKDIAVITVVIPLAVTAAAITTALTFL